MRTSRRMLLFLPFLLLAFSCSSQDQQIDRLPAVAGQFYPADRRELTRTLDALFAKAAPRSDSGTLLALIVPHAGYVYSGGVAASGFNQIDPDRLYGNIFVIGSSHHSAFEGAAIYTAGDFITPLGPVQVNRTLGQELVTRYPLFSSRTDPHANEHSLEVQLPFLQRHIRKPFAIIPILLGSVGPDGCRALAEALRPYLKPGNLFVISSDFSHYPPYDRAASVDRATAGAITSNTPATLISTLDRNDRAGVPGLATSLCGWSSVLTLMEMTAGNPSLAYHTIQYCNSGDVPAGDRNRVVGYYAITVTQKPFAQRDSFGLSQEERKTLLAIARSTITAYVKDHTLPPMQTGAMTDALKTPCGAFVTLNKHGRLRGCIGRFDATEPLYTVVQQMAVASATQDTRFDPVSPAEVADLEIEISVLTPMKKITSIADIRLGRDGIYMRKGGRSGTFLPQVATETGWSLEELLGHCAQDKAGIGWNGWKDAELYTYEALVFSEQEHPPAR